MLERFAVSVALAHAVSTLMMVGIIWFVQIAHYPLLFEIGHRQFPQYISRNGWKTGYVVAPVMSVEVVTACLLLFLPYITVALSLRIAGVVLVVFIWTSTVLIQMPILYRLRRDWNRALIQRLIYSNWVRTVGWSLRGFIAVRIVKQLGFF